MKIVTSFEHSICLNHFKAFMDAHDFPDYCQVGYFGSTRHPDPEIEVVLSKLENSKIYSIGLADEVDIRFNLDRDKWLDKTSFDLLIVSNVLEHVWNLENTFDNFNTMMKESSYIYIVGPTSNYYHLSPNFFSSGYTYDFILNNLAKRHFKTIIAGGIGSQRLNFMQHALRSWPSKKAHSLPLLFAYDEVRFPLRLYLYFKNFFCIVISQFKSSLLVSDPNFYTGMYLIMQKKIC
jgi:hypothetical protein